jgi:hypothetical protein
MKFMCMESCVDSTNVVSYREGNVYDLNEKGIEHLKKIDQFRRFQPADMEARLFLKGVKSPGQKDLKDMTKAELLAYAKEKDIAVDQAVNKETILQAIEEAESFED